jgi:opacity protein-like surface antigen
VLPVLLLIAGVASSSSAQTKNVREWTREASAGFALGHVFRYEDQTFGDRPNVSVSLALLHRSRLGFEFEVDRTLGLTPAPAPCGIVINKVPATCVGDAHDGIRSAAIASVSAQYQFKGERVRPYLIGGLGVLHSNSVWSRADVKGTQVTLTEQEQSDTGFGPDLGAGLRIAPARNVVIRPEIRWLDASWISQANLAVTRISVRAGYSW